VNITVGSGGEIPGRRGLRQERTTTKTTLLLLLLLLLFSTWKENCQLLS
jgi:hypothetical protein